MRVLQVYDGLSARTINGIAFRRDGGLSGNYLESTVTYQIYVSNSATTATTVDSTFDNNHGANVQRVANGAANFPATPGSEPAPSPFLFQLPFNAATPFHFNGVGSLCVDIRISSTTRRTGVRLDVVSGSQNNPPPFWKAWGTGCRHTNGVGLAALGTSASPNWRNQPKPMMQFRYDGSRLPSPLAVLILGSSVLAPPVQLPLTTSGLSGPCFAYTNFVADLPTAVNGSGNLTRIFTVPVLPSYNGASIFGQVYALAPQANQLGVVSTNVVQHNLIAPYGPQPLGQVIGSPSTAPTGTARSNYGLVTEFN